MSLKPLNILLADDDADDCSFFEKALMEIPIATHLKTVPDGEQLMDYLFKNLENLPEVLFLDLNMPLKNGFECLVEIKENERFRNLPVVMFSTAFPKNSIYEEELINNLLKIGALHFIRKPNDIGHLSQEVYQALNMVAEKINFSIG